MRSKTKLTALCGMMTALCVVIMLPSSVIPVLTYVAPMLTGAVICAVCVLAGRKRAFAVYAAAGVLSMIILTDKEAALFFVLFFGYYPIVREPLSKLGRGASILLKLLIFNVSVVLASLLAVYVFLVPAEEFTELGAVTIPLYLAVGNGVFLLYDYSLAKYNPIIKRFVSRIRL